MTSNCDGFVTAVNRHLRNVPMLKFREDRPTQLRLVYPRLQSPQYPATQRIPEAFREFFHLASRKHRYDNPYRSDWDNFVAFANDGIEIDEGAVQQIQSEPVDGERFVNASRDTARQWLENDLIPILQQSRSRKTIFVTGKPGSGKSTFFKYLLNKYNTELAKAKIICSRFESVKFRDFHTVDPSGKTLTLVARLEDYIYHVLLRDIIHTLAYYSTPIGRKRSELGFFASSQIDATFEQAVPNEVATREKDKNLLIEALSEHSFSPQLLRSLGLDTKKFLVGYFAERVKLCLVVDGLDFVTLAHKEMDPQTYEILTVLINTFALAGATAVAAQGNARLAIPFDLHALFVLRNSTFKVAFEARANEMVQASTHRWEIAPVDYRTLIHLAVRRGLVELSRTRRLRIANDVDSLSNKLTIATLSILGAVERQASRRVSANAMQLFNGNYRHCFEFLERLFAWLLRLARVEEVIDDVEPPFRNAIEFIASDEPLRLIRQRGYRMLEFLLFHEGWSFENALSLVGRYDEYFMPGTPTAGRLKINTQCSGYIDNLFNYHIERHAEHPDDHCFLEKIRILQALA